ncbi:hypothetical protein [Larkinella sp. C7]|jgi:cytoskeletal protein RodZ|uniref:hypothetical protein n=1 Tax=Larkinella sp. C7 TaxID=2576607 RepID=UPI0011110949|nr:hypothetical protein [Larkinella sp. C7]
MKKVQISIRDLFRSKASEEKKTEQTTTTQTEEATESTSAESTADDESDADESESESTAVDETEETTTEGETTSAEAMADKGQVQVKEMSLTAYNQLVAGAKAWNENKDRFAALLKWEAAIKSVGGKGAAVDQNTQNGKTKPGVLDQPWNRAAMKAAGKAE